MHVYETITNKLIAQLEAGIIPWRKEWKTTGESGLPANFATKKPYRGINILTLMSTRYESRWWLTYKQAQELGGQVRKGEKGEQIVFWKFDKRPNKDTGEDERFAFARVYTVFNLEQIDGLTTALPFDVPAFDPIAEAENVVTLYMASGNHPTLGHGGSRAFYRPSTDHVQMPEQTAFSHSRAYYATLFHEFAHSTAHEARLDRKVTGHVFGDADYSKEELVAEFASAFLCADAGISNDELLTNSAAYMQCWIKALKNDKTVAVSAAQQAQKACDFILARTFADAAVSE